MGTFAKIRWQVRYNGNSFYFRFLWLRFYRLFTSAGVRRMGSNDSHRYNLCIKDVTTAGRARVPLTLQISLDVHGSVGRPLRPNALSDLRAVSSIYKTKHRRLTMVRKRIAGHPQRYLGPLGRSRNR